MMIRHFGVKPLIAVVVGFAAIQSNAQLELTHHYVTNDTDEPIDMNEILVTPADLANCPMLKEVHRIGEPL